MPDHEPGCVDQPADARADSVRQWPADASARRRPGTTDTVAWHSLPAGEVLNRLQVNEHEKQIRLHLAEPKTAMPLDERSP